MAEIMSRGTIVGSEELPGSGPAPRRRLVGTSCGRGPIRWPSIVSWALTATLLAGGCATDPTVEDDVPPAAGAVQPASTDTATIGVQKACDDLTEAQAAARERLGCSDPDAGPSCEILLSVAGSLPCDRVRADTVEACVGVISGYTSCQQFTTRACIVTVEADSCRTPVPPVPGEVDSGGGGVDAGYGGAGGSAGGGTGGTGGADASSPPGGAGGITTDAGDAAPSVDATAPTDAALDSPG
jgi:hypothetical protein